MSTLRTTHIQHPSSSAPNITLSEDGSVQLPGLASDIGDLGDVDTTGVSDGDVLSYASSTSSWAPTQLSFDLDDLSDVNTTEASDGDVLTYSSATSTWVPLAVDPPPSALDDLSDVNAPSPSAGQALIFDGSSWSPNQAGAQFVEVLGDFIEIDMSQDSIRSRTTDNAVTFSGFSYTEGKSCTLRLTSINQPLSLTFPSGWKFVSFKPTELAGSRTGILSITCFGDSESDVVAAWANEA